MTLLPSTILTRRLALRPPLPGDAPAIFRSYTQDPEVARYMTWRPHRAVEETEQFVGACIAAWAGDARFPWVITRREADTPIGMVELRIEGHAACLGYVLARAEWGRGYMTEAVKAVRDRVLAIPTIYRLWAVCDVENGASARVLEKVGLLREGRLRRCIIHPNLSDEPRDAYLYAAVR